MLVACPDCGREVEIFTDEPKRRCRCGTIVRREALPRCADWCPAAPQCLGDRLDVEEWQQRLARARNDPHAREYVAGIQRLLARRRNGERP